MPIFEVLPDGRDDWPFSHDIDAHSLSRAAEKYAEYIDFTSTEFAYVRDGGIVQVRLKGANPIYRVQIIGETRPHYEGNVLHSPTPTSDKGDDKNG